jgi:putative intracellular protease/amidase
MKSTMTKTRPKKIAALLADAFQEEEFFLPKVALARAGYTVVVVSLERRPIEMYSYFAQTGLLNVDRAVAEANPDEYAAITCPLMRPKARAYSPSRPRPASRSTGRMESPLPV